MAYLGAADAISAVRNMIQEWALMLEDERSI